MLAGDLVHDAALGGSKEGRLPDKMCQQGLGAIAWWPSCIYSLSKYNDKQAGVGSASALKHRLFVTAPACILLGYRLPQQTWWTSCKACLAIVILPRQAAEQVAQDIACNTKEAAAIVFTLPSFLGIMAFAFALAFSGLEALKAD